jgi:hypothetical protein
MSSVFRLLSFTAKAQTDLMINVEFLVFNSANMWICFKHNNSKLSIEN